MCHVISASVWGLSLLKVIATLIFLGLKLGESLTLHSPYLVIKSDISKDTTFVTFKTFESQINQDLGNHQKFQNLHALRD